MVNKGNNMQRFKAFRIHSTDGNINAGFETIDLNDLSEGEVLIRSAYSGINYKDALAATGQGRILQRFPLVAGIDVAGYVEHSSDARFQPGAPVLVCGAGLSETRDGGYAEFVRLAADSVVALPDNLSPYQTMAIGTAGFTAALAIYQMQRNNQTPTLGPVAVTGATGGVGSFAIDLLSGLGYDVTAITRKRDHAYLKTLGAQQVVHVDELTQGKKPLETASWGGAVDCVGGDMLSWLTRTVKPFGNIAAIGLTGGIQLETTVMPFILRGINLLGINSVYCPKQLRDEIWRLLAEQWRPQHIEKIVSAEINFKQLPEQFEAYLNGEVTGRTVVKIE